MKYKSGNNITFKDYHEFRSSLSELHEAGYTWLDGRSTLDTDLLEQYWAQHHEKVFIRVHRYDYMNLAKSITYGRSDSLNEIERGTLFTPYKGKEIIKKRLSKPEFPKL